jgi:hypothetical protein
MSVQASISINSELFIEVVEKQAKAFPRISDWRPVSIATRILDWDRSFLSAIHIDCPKNSTHCHRRSGG